MAEEVRYISHGDLEDGGYRHEKFFAESLAESTKSKYLELRKRKLFYGLANVKLIIWSFFKATAENNVVAARLGISSWLRNIFNTKQTYVVVHDYDKNRYNSLFLRVYFPLLFWGIKIFKPNRVKVVVVSEYWVKYFNETKGIPLNNLKLFPNLLEVKLILAQRSLVNKKTIHLGQYSIKNSDLVFDISSKLSKKGYFCYFSTLDKGLAMECGDYSVVYFNSHADYLKRMAESEFTLGFSKYHEGWNRVVHESVLLNTPVIAFKKGGMQYLVKESDCFLVDSVEEALEIIERRVEYRCPKEFLYKYDVSQRQNYF